jgi:hypothetical protein
MGDWMMAALRALLALPLVLPMSAAETQFNDKAFCDVIKQFAEKANKDTGSMLDPVTRSDGMAVMCETKIVDFKKFLIVDDSNLRDGWLQKQQQWNDIYCKDNGWSKAIANGWTVTQTLTSVNGKRYSIKAECR